MASSRAAETTQRFWRAIEALPGQCGVDAEWRQLLTEERQLAARFLRPDGRESPSYPCPRACGCAHDVIHHGADDIVAVCSCEPRKCDPHALTRADIALYQVDHRALGDALAVALGAAPAHAKLAHPPTTWSVGTYCPFAGHRFPVYLTVQLEPDDLVQAIATLVAQAEGPFLLLAPTRELCRPRCEDMLRRVNARLIVLAEEFVLEDAGTLATRRPVAELLDPFLAATLPASKQTMPMAFLPTPPEATWEAVKIKFRDGHTVSVRVGDVHGVFTYSQMGMADAKSGSPTKQWDLLRVFAMGHGRLDWSSRDADRKNQKRKEKLSANLRAFFRIDGDPFEVMSSVGGEGKGWRSRFSLDPDE